MTGQLLTVNQIAAKLQVSPSWIYNQTRKCGTDSIPVIRVGKHCRFFEDDVLEWLKRQAGSDEDSCEE